MGSASNVIFFTGAPRVSDLSWQEDGLLTEDELRIPTFLGQRHERIPRAPKPPLSVPSSGWRLLNLKRPYLSIDGASITDPDEASRHVKLELDTSFCTTASLSFLSLDQDSTSGQTGSLLKDEASASQFYEHSFAIHENLPSSQLALLTSSLESTESEHASFLTASFTSFHNDDGSNATIPELPAVPITPNVTDLRNIPNASYLDSIIPQVMTVNVIVAIISISPPRTVLARRSGIEMEIVELLVADESRSGFGINFWLPGQNSAGRSGTESNHLKGTLAALRLQDIIVVRNLSLSSHQGKVFGQSMRKNLTKMDLLYRRPIYESPTSGVYKTSHLRSHLHSIDNPQVEKVRKVRNWIMQFLGPSEWAIDNAAQSSKTWKDRQNAAEQLPPDTQ